MEPDSCSQIFFFPPQLEAYYYLVITDFTLTRIATALWILFDSRACFLKEHLAYLLSMPEEPNANEYTSEISF